MHTQLGSKAACVSEWFLDRETLVPRNLEQAAITVRELWQASQQAQGNGKVPRPQGAESKVSEDREDREDRRDSVGVVLN